MEHGKGGGGRKVLGGEKPEVELGSGSLETWKGEGLRSECRD